MLETESERLLRIARGDPRDPLEEEVSLFNARIAAARASARGEPKVSVPRARVVDHDDPLGVEIAGFNEKVAALRAAAARKVPT